MPLTGITVVEIGENIAGPFSAMVLGDFGATVYKIENPRGGDSTRHLGGAKPYGSSITFHAVNRNKRSVVLDFTKPEDAGLLRRFILEKADVFIQNMRPGTLAKYGLDPDDLRRENPRLICCSVRAFSKAGENRDKPGYDFMMQAFAGMLAVTGPQGGEPCRVGMAISDYSTAQWLVIGVLKALRERDQSGQGCHVETSLFEVMLNLLGVPIGNYMMSGTEPGRWGSGIAYFFPYQAFPTADRPVAVAPGNERLFRAFCTALGHPEWADDPRFTSMQARWDHREALHALIVDALKGDVCDEWVKRFEAAGVPAGPVNAIADVVASREFAASGIAMPVPGRPDLRVLRNPLHVDGARDPIERAPPDYGEGTADFRRLMEP